jgi:MiaB/RimO family radical SAM methylthiotransferase
MRKVYLWSNGCERRLLDTKRFSEYLIKNNYSITNKPENADLIILVSCSFIDRLTNEALNKIITFQKQCDAELIVAGCLPAIDKEKLDHIFTGKTVITSYLNGDMNKIDILFPENKIKFRDMQDANTYELNYEEKTKFLIGGYHKIKRYACKNLFGRHSLFYSPLYEKSFYIRISWGCLGNCSYCGIKKAVVPFESKPIEQCIKEFEKGLQEGYETFILSGDDTGAYGSDVNSTFPALLDNMTKLTGEYNITIRDLNPFWLVKYIEDLEEIFKRNKITYLDVPIQSGASRILKLMNRYSNIELMKDAFIRLKRISPNAVINTHYIVGFPSETEEEFKQTLSFIKEVSFDNIIVIPFSLKTGTKAERIEPKITDEEISKRVDYAKYYFKKTGYHTKIKPVANYLLAGKKILSFS